MKKTVNPSSCGRIMRYWVTTFYILLLFCIFKNCSFLILFVVFVLSLCSCFVNEVKAHLLCLCQVPRGTMAHITTRRIDSGFEGIVLDFRNICFSVIQLKNIFNWDLSRYRFVFLLSNLASLCVFFLFVVVLHFSVVILCLFVVILDLFVVVLCLFAVICLTFQQKMSTVTDYRGSGPVPIHDTNKPVSWMDYWGDGVACHALTLWWRKSSLTYGFHMSFKGKQKVWQTTEMQSVKPRSVD